jgi:hypothetical protein
MFRSGMRRLQDVRRVRWQHLAWRPIKVVFIVVHVLHSSHRLSGTRGDVWYGVADRSSVHQLRKIWRRAGCRCTSHPGCLLRVVQTDREVSSSLRNITILDIFKLDRHKIRHKWGLHEIVSVLGGQRGRRDRVNSFSLKR